MAVQQSEVADHFSKWNLFSVCTLNVSSLSAAVYCGARHCYTVCICIEVLTNPHISSLVWNFPFQCVSILYWLLRTCEVMHYFTTTVVPFQPPNLPTPQVANAVVYHMQACFSLSRVRLLKPHLAYLVFLFLTTLPMFSGPLPILTSYQFLTLVSFLFLALSLQLPQLFGTPLWTQSISFSFWW